MTRDGKIQLAGALVLAASMTGAGVLSVALAGEAGRAKLVMTDRAEENAPWEVSVGIAMGAFRGIFVNMLWMRANELKEKGKFYEAVQLSDAITRLQPRFPRVWIFHAWNLAYNMSVETQTAGERWEWVNRGIDLLRTKGIPANPTDMSMHKELGWIFLHKVGGNTDDANIFYKKQFSQEWTIAVGEPPAKTKDDRDRAAVINRYAAWIAAYRDAPTSLDAAVQAEPSVAGLVAGLKAGELEPDWDMLRRWEMWRAMKRSGTRTLWEKSAGPKMLAIGKLADDPAMAKAWPVLVNTIRRKTLIEKYNMDPGRMVRYTETYGPLDWRHFAAHSLYWSALGVEASGNRWNSMNKADFDFINTDRITAQSVQELFRSGDLYFDFFSSTVPNRYALWLGVPNPHFVQSYGDILEAMVARSWADNPQMRGTMPLATGYENFIKDAITFFYARGEYEEAEKWRDKLRNFKYLTMNDPERARILALPLKEFVEHELEEDLGRPSVAVQQVSGSLQAAYVALLGRNPDLFLKQYEYAKRVHRYFMEMQHRLTVVANQEGRMDQMPNDFRVVAAGQFVGFMNGLGLDDAETVYDAAPDDLKAFAYDLLTMQFREDLDTVIKNNPTAGMRSFDQIFPPPPGLDEARELVRAWQAARTREGANVERK